MRHASHSSVVGRVAAWRRALSLVPDRPILGHGTMAGATVIGGGWWYSSLVQALYDTGVAGFIALMAIHITSVLLPLTVWWRQRRDRVASDLLMFGLANFVLVMTSQFSNFFFVGFPWILIGLTMAAVDSRRRAEPDSLLRAAR
jgi:O-antigen ligase